MRILTDNDVDRLATADVVAASMQTALLAAANGEFITPPPVLCDLADERMTFTCGRVPGDWFGSRSYTYPGTRNEDQVVVVHDDTTRHVRGPPSATALGRAA